MRVHLPAPAFHIGTEPAVIVKIGTAAAVILGTGSPDLFPGGAGLVTAFIILGTAALTGKHGQALLSIQAPAASSGKAAASAMGVLVPAVRRQELPPAVPVRFYYTGPALRGFVPCVNCRGSQNFPLPRCLPAPGVLKWQLTAGAAWFPG